MKYCWFFLILICGCGDEPELRSKEELNSLFIKACRDEDVYEIESLIAEGADPNATYIKKDSIMTYYAVGGDKNMVKLLLPYSDEKNLLASVEHCVKLEDVDMIDILLKNSGNDELKKAAFINAAYSSKPEVLLKAMEYAKFLSDYSSMVSSVIFNLVEDGNIDILKILVDNGANINIGFDNYTLLMWAVKHNQKEILEFLIAKGLDVNEPNLVGQTPLMLSISPDVELNILKSLWNNAAEEKLEENNRKNITEYAKILFINLFEKIKFLDLKFSSEEIASEDLMNISSLEVMDHETEEEDLMEENIEIL